MKLEIDLDIPAGIIDGKFEQELRQEAILRLFAERKISAARAGRLLGITRLQFMDLTRTRGIPYISYTAEDFADDLRDLDAFDAKAASQPESNR